MEAKAVLKLGRGEDSPARNVLDTIPELEEIPDSPLPESMEITFEALIKMPEGPYDEPGTLHFHHVAEIKMTVTPTTTVGEMKEYLLDIMPGLEYNRIEIKYQNENLPDKMNVKQIDYQGPFMLEKTLQMLIFSRDRMYKEIYKYFINTGVSQEIAKKHTEKIMQYVDIESVKPNKMKICRADCADLIQLFPMFLP